MDSKNCEGVHHFTEGMCVPACAEMSDHMLAALLANGFPKRNVVHQLHGLIHRSLHIADRIEFACNIMGDEGAHAVRVCAEHRTGAADSLGYRITEAFSD